MPKKETEDKKKKKRRWRPKHEGVGFFSRRNLEGAGTESGESLKNVVELLEDYHRQ